MTVTAGTVDAVGYAALGSTSRSVTVDASANYLLVAMNARAGITTRTVTYAGASMTELGASVGGGGIDVIYLFGLANPATGANTLAWTVDSTPTGVISALPVIGANPASPLHDQGGGVFVVTNGQNPGTAGSTGTVVSAVGELIVGAICCLADTDITLTPTGSGTEQYQIRPANANTSRCSMQTLAGAATGVETWTLGTSTHWNSIAVSVQALAGQAFLPQGPRVRFS